MRFEEAPQEPGAPGLGVELPNTLVPHLVGPAPLLATHLLEEGLGQGDAVRAPAPRAQTSEAAPSQVSCGQSTRRRSVRGKLGDGESALLQTTQEPRRRGAAHQDHILIPGQEHGQALQGRLHGAHPR